jgi:catechol 2,3-dioxygenase-like lactoylglutathione lyase family enzyme
MSKVTRVNHIGMPVSDLARSVKWYEDVLGIAPTGVTIAATNPSLGAVVEVENPSMRASFALAGDNVLFGTHPVRQSAAEALRRA